MIHGVLAAAPKRLPGALLLTAFMAMVCAAPMRAQTPAGSEAVPPIPVPRITEIVFDGRVDEAAWEVSEPVPVVMHLPDFGAPASERTEFRMAHDGRFFYFSCRAYDSDPEGIRAPSLLRDERRFINDSCSIYLDTFNDEENAMGFVTTPSGLRADLAVANDAESSPNPDWDTFWDVAVSQDQQGWYAEFRIPFSSLLFQAEDGRVVMGVSMLRNIARKNERIVFPEIPPRWGMNSFRKPSQMRKLVLEGVEESDPPLYVTPYGLAGGGYAHALNAERTAWERRNERVRELGGDLKYGLTSNLTLDLTVNTDFAQVEADDQQVNLTRFSLFFPEKRRFFQERGAVFEYPLGGNERLFHSRRIGLAGGEPVRIYGGIRIVGRVGEWDVGALDMQTAESDALPSENQGVLRLRRRVLNANSYLGGILTNRLGTGGHRNVVYGVDGIFRVVGQDYLTLNWAQSFDGQEAPAAGGSPDFFERALVRSVWERRGEDGLTYGLGLTRAGEVFEPGMGYLQRRDYVKLEGALGHGWRPQGESPRFLTYGLNLDGTAFRRNADGVVETVDVTLTGLLETAGQHLLTLTVPARYDKVEEAFELSDDALVPEGIYRFVRASLQYRPPQGPPFRPTLSLDAGQYYDGSQFSVSFMPSWSVSRHLSLSGSYSLDHIDLPERDQSLTAHIARFRAEVMFSTATSLVAFVQYNSTRSSVLANFRFRFNPREGTDLYIVWNEGLVDRFASDPARPRTDQRTLLFKYAQTLLFGI